MRHNVPRCVGTNSDVSEETASQQNDCMFVIRCSPSQLQVTASSAGLLAKKGEIRKQMKVRRQIENDVKNERKRVKEGVKTSVGEEMGK